MICEYWLEAAKIVNDLGRSFDGRFCLNETEPMDWKCNGMVDWNDGGSRARLIGDNDE
jgi:hypothetical protein